MVRLAVVASTNESVVVRAAFAAVRSAAVMATALVTVTVPNGLFIGTEV